MPTTRLHLWGKKKTARCAFCCWVKSHPRRGTSYFQDTSANFLEKYFRRKPKETKKLMADGLDAVLRLVQCSLGLDPLGERTSKVPAFTVVRGNVRERMLPRCICCTHKQCCSVCLSVLFFSVQHLPSFFPLECRWSFPSWSWPGEVHTFLSRHRVLSMASAQYSVMTKG